MISASLSCIERSCIGHDAGKRLRGQVLERGDLRKGEPDRAQRLDRRDSTSSGVGKGSLPTASDEALQNRVGRDADELLMRDGARERLKRRTSGIRRAGDRDRARGSARPSRGSAAAEMGNDPCAHAGCCRRHVGDLVRASIPAVTSGASENVFALSCRHF